MAKQALASPFIKHMDVEYARLARDLPLPKGISTAPKANVIENATASYKSPNSAGPTNDVSSFVKAIMTLHYIIQIKYAKKSIFRHVYLSQFAKQM